MATVGGNMLQRTRCAYFYDDEGSRCNKRSPGQGCDAAEGFNRYHAILGASTSCVATHPSDMCVALAALGAVVHLRNARGERTLPFTDLHRLPEDHPEIETLLEPGELITAIELPAMPFAARSTYRKVRDRSSYAFALVSVAAALELDGDTVKDVRIAWAAWRTSPGAHGRRKRRCGAGPATAEAFPCRRPGRTGARAAAARQRIQGGTGDAHDHRRARRTEGDESMSVIQEAVQAVMKKPSPSRPTPGCPAASPIR
jgi:xanthine dehydrogenase YagS FAD-binding subunit